MLAKIAADESHSTTEYLLSYITILGLMNCCCHYVGKQWNVISNANTTIIKTLQLLLLFFIVSCDSLSGHIEQDVDNKVAGAKDDMDAKDQKAQEDFTAQYQATEKGQTDSLNKRKLEKFSAFIMGTGAYMDSLKREMDRIDIKDVQNTEVVKATFLYEGAGDSIIHKLKMSIAAAQDVAKTNELKLAIRAASDSLFTELSNDKWKENLFGVNNSLGARMIIYGLQKELYRIGIKALSDK